MRSTERSIIAIERRNWRQSSSVIKGVAILEGGMFLSIRVLIAAPKAKRRKKGKLFAWVGHADVKIGGVVSRGMRFSL